MPILDLGGSKCYLMKFDEKFILGLFLFVRMLQLSFDRALGGRWESLVEYLSSQPNCRNVVSLLLAICGYDLIPKTVPKKPFTISFKATRLVPKRLTLSKDELLFIAWWLLKAADLIERGECAPSVDEITEVRFNLACAEELIRSRLRNKDQLIEYVEHFNQSDINKCRSIEEIVEGSWPRL